MMRVGACLVEGRESCLLKICGADANESNFCTTINVCQGFEILATNASQPSGGPLPL